MEVHAVDPDDEPVGGRCRSFGLLGSHIRAQPRAALGVTLLAEPGDRLAHRRTTHIELTAERAFGRQLAARQQPVFPDLRDQVVVDFVGEIFLHR